VSPPKTLHDHEKLSVMYLFSVESFRIWETLPCYGAVNSPRTGKSPRSWTGAPRMNVRVGLEASTRGKATLSYCDRDAATVAVAGRIDVARRATTSALSGYWGSYVGPS
jgi:hypothetical protein